MWILHLSVDHTKPRIGPTGALNGRKPIDFPLIWMVSLYALFVTTRKSWDQVAPSDTIPEQESANLNHLVEKKTVFVSTYIRWIRAESLKSPARYYCHTLHIGFSVLFVLKIPPFFKITVSKIVITIQNKYSSTKYVLGSLDIFFQYRF